MKNHYVILIEKLEEIKKLKKEAKKNEFIKDSKKFLKQKRTEIKKKIVKQDKQQYKLDNLFDINKRLTEQLKEFREQKKILQQTIKR